MDFLGFVDTLLLFEGRSRCWTRSSPARPICAFVGVITGSSHNQWSMQRPNHHLDGPDASCRGRKGLGFRTRIGRSAHCRRRRYLPLECPLLECLLTTTLSFACERLDESGDLRVPVSGNVGNERGQSPAHHGVDEARRLRFPQRKDACRDADP